MIISEEERSAFLEKSLTKYIHFVDAGVGVAIRQLSKQFYAIAFSFVHPEDARYFKRAARGICNRKLKDFVSREGSKDVLAVPVTALSAKGPDLWQAWSSLHEPCNTVLEAHKTVPMNDRPYYKYRADDVRDQILAILIGSTEATPPTAA